MKKLLLIAASTVVLASSVCADDNSNFYLRGDLGYNQFSKWQFNNSIFGTSKENKYSASTIDFGAGYKVTDKIRTELVYSHNFINEFTYLGKLGLEIGLVKYNIEHKSSIDSVMLKGSFDIIELSQDTKLFIGAGAGIASIKNKFEFLATLDGLSHPDLNHATSQKKNNFAYTVALGYATKFSKNVTFEAQYNFSDCGKSSTPRIRTNEDDHTLGKKIHYRAHGFKIGVRVDI